MAANPWIPGAGSPPPPPDRQDNDERSTAPTDDAEGAPAGSASYADRFLAARKSADQTDPHETEQPSANSAESQAPPDINFGTGAETKADRPASGKSRAQTDRREEEAARLQERQIQAPPPEIPHPAPAPADKDRKLLHALLGKREKTPNAKLGKLSRKRERHAVANLRELSLVEGNLMGLGTAARTLYFTSCFAGEGKTTALLEAAYGLAIHGSRTTLLIDGNSDNPCLHGEFGLPNRNGFRDVLRNAASLSEAIHPTIHESLYVMPCGSGKSTPDPATLADMLRTLADNFDFVLIDGKPLLSSSEVSATAPKMDGVLLVVECEKTKWEVVQLAQDKLSAVDAKNTGVVLNRRRFYIPKPIYRLMSR